MDFFEDILIGQQRELTKDGITLPPYDQSKAVTTLARCIEYQMRRISTNKRDVHLSCHLKKSVEYTQHQSSVDNLKNLSEAGSDITPFQSKTIDNFAYSELLLFDWGIQHLHLGSHQEGQTFSARTGPLLFAMYRNTDAYFISILNHGSWAEIDLLNIIDIEWPHLLDPFTIKGITGISPVPTPEETLELRKAGIMAMQQLSSGRILSSPGGGITTAKTSTAAMMDAQRLARMVHHLEELVKNNELEIRQKTNSQSGERIRLFQFEYYERKAIVGSEETKKTINIQF